MYGNLFMPSPTAGGDGYGLYLDGTGDVFMHVCISPNSSNSMY